MQIVATPNNIAESLDGSGQGLWLQPESDLKHTNDCTQKTTLMQKRYLHLYIKTTGHRAEAKQAKWIFALSSAKRQIQVFNCSL